MEDDKKKKKKKIDVSKYINIDPVINEDDDTLDERAPLTVSQRRARGRTMRRYKNRIAIARKRAARKKASPEKLKTRARKKARQIIRDRLAGGKKYSEMTPAEKIQLDKRVLRIPDSAISRIATRQLPTVRKGEMERLARVRGSGSTANESLDEQFERLINEMRECPPKRHHMALTKEGQVKFDGRFKFFKKKKMDESSLYEFLDDAIELMEMVESNLNKDADDPCWKGFVQLGTKKVKGKEVPNCVPMESVNPEDREQGTDSLVKIYKDDTPMQKDANESYYDSDIDSEYGPFAKGNRVRFTDHSMDMIDAEEKQGVVVGSNVSHLRVRDDSGKLFLVRHDDAEMVEQAAFFTIDESFELKFINEAALIDKAIEAIHRHVIKGKDLQNVAWDFVTATGVNIPTQELMRNYIKTYGDPNAPKKVDPKRASALIRKYS